MKIVIDNKIPQLEERIREAHPEIDLAVLAREDTCPAMVKDADALIVRTHTRCNEALLKGSRVRLVGTATIGKNHIDEEWCGANGIRVVNAPGCNAPAVMQYVACALHEARFNPNRHTLGVVGKGNVGSCVVELFRKAGAEVLVCDPPRKDKGFSDEDYLPLDELMHRCDAVTFHVPLYAPGPNIKYPTYHLLNAQTADLSNNPRLKILVNASRGGVMDVAFLESNPQVTLIVDTWPFEDDSAAKAVDTSKLVSIPLISTPHIAGYSIQGKERATRRMIEALNDTFDLKISTEGLAEYRNGDWVPDLQKVIESYDIKADSVAFKSSPDSLEQLRNDYNLRDENFFS